MFEPSSLLCILPVVLGVIMLVGHGMWVVLAAIWKAVFGPTPHETAFRRLADDELHDLATIQRQLRRLVERGTLDPATFDRLAAVLNERRRELLLGELRPV